MRHESRTLPETLERCAVAVSCLAQSTSTYPALLPQTDLLLRILCPSFVSLLVGDAEFNDTSELCNHWWLPESPGNDGECPKGANERLQDRPDSRATNSSNHSERVRKSSEPQPVIASAWQTMNVSRKLFPHNSFPSLIGGIRVSPACSVHLRLRLMSLSRPFCGRRSLARHGGTQRWCINVKTWLLWPPPKTDDRNVFC